MQPLETRQQNDSLTLTDLEIAAMCLAVARDPQVDLTCRQAVEQWLQSQPEADSAQLDQLRDRLGLSA